MKKIRQQQILQLIQAEPIDTQEDLQRALERHGISVTQATVSRDIKELRLVKALDAQGRYCYVSSAQTGRQNIQYIDIFTKSVVKIDSAMNDVVIKCHAGMAQGACAALDHLVPDLVVGTLAGDDTILAITKNETAADELVHKLHGLLS